MTGGSGAAARGRREDGGGNEDDDGVTVSSAAGGAASTTGFFDSSASATLVAVECGVEPSTGESLMGTSAGPGANSLSAESAAAADAGGTPGEQG